MLREFAYALRGLRKSPGFSLLAIFTLTLGIGLTTAVFTLVDSVIVRPLAYRDSNQLMVLWERVKFLGPSLPKVGPNLRHIEIWQQRAYAFQQLSFVRHTGMGLAIGNEHPKVAGVLIASANLLDTFGVQPLLGRQLQPSDCVKGSAEVALISYELWDGAFQKSDAVIGQTIRLSGRPITVVGVLPKHFDIPAELGTFSLRSSDLRSEVLMPAMIDRQHSYGWNSDYGNWTVIARLKSGVAVQQAQSQLDVLQREIVRQMPAGQQERSPDALLSLVQPLQEAVVGESRTVLWVLLAAVTSLMLIACVNLANAQLGRSIVREREIAILSAVGASPLQILSSLLAENLLLAIAGGASGVLLASELLRLFQALSPINLPRMAEISINLPVLLFAALITCSALFFIGLLPALKLLSTDPQMALQESANRSYGSRRVSRIRTWLIGLQVAACTTLLLITGLLTSSLWHLLTSDKGFSSAQVMSAQVELQADAYRPDSARVAFDDAVLENFRKLPGVQSASLLSALPLEGETWLDSITVSGQSAMSSPLANWRWVSPGYSKP